MKHVQASTRVPIAAETAKMEVNLSLLNIVRITADSQVSSKMPMIVAKMKNVAIANIATVQNTMRPLESCSQMTCWLLLA